MPENPPQFDQLPSRIQRFLRGDATHYRRDEVIAGHDYLSNNWNRVLILGLTSPTGDTNTLRQPRHSSDPRPGRVALRVVNEYDPGESPPNDETGVDEAILFLDLAEVDQLINYLHAARLELLMQSQEIA